MENYCSNGEKSGGGMSSGTLFGGEMSVHHSRHYGKEVSTNNCGRSRNEMKVV